MTDAELRARVRRQVVQAMGGGRPLRADQARDVDVYVASIMASIGAFVAAEVAAAAELSR